MKKAETVKVLNDLIQTSEDGRKGFAEASEEATKAELKTMFKRRSADCGMAVTELQQLVGSLGGTADDSGTIAGTLHRGWVKVKTAVGDPNLTMLNEIENAEDKAKASYAKALATKLPEQIRVVVKRQHEGAVKNHDLIRDLRNSYKKAAKASAVI